MDFDVFRQILTREFPFADDAALEKFARLDALYRDWNSKINVISRKDVQVITGDQKTSKLSQQRPIQRNIKL